MAYWLKIGYFTDSQEAASNYWLERTWVSDSPGRISPWWKKYERPRKGTVYPPHGPQYRIGDRLVIYITEKGVCPAILEVIAEPRWDPGWVDARSGRGEGKEWGVVTDVRGIWSLSLDDAPPIEDIGVARARVQRHGHISLGDLEYEAAERFIAKRRPGKPRSDQSENALVPIETSNSEEYEITRPESGKRAVRREAKLVRDYAAILEAGGDEVVRNKLLPLAHRTRSTATFTTSPESNWLRPRRGRDGATFGWQLGNWPTTGGSFPRARIGQCCLMPSRRRTYLFSSIPRESPRRK